MAEEIPDPQALARIARQTLSSAERRRKYRKIDFLDSTWWYETQLAFFKAGSSGAHQRLISGGNQTGKSESCAFEVGSDWTRPPIERIKNARTRFILRLRDNTEGSDCCND